MWFTATAPALLGGKEPTGGSLRLQKSSEEDGRADDGVFGDIIVVGTGIPRSLGPSRCMCSFMLGKVERGFWKKFVGFVGSSSIDNTVLPPRLPESVDERLPFIHFKHCPRSTSRRMERGIFRIACF
jgi:hypothetical protein